MKSFAFPKIFSKNKTNIVSGKEATISNLLLLLKSQKKQLFGDPYYGTDLYKYLFQNNDLALYDLIKDDIYTTILNFMPQLKLTKDNINIVTSKTSLSVQFTAYDVSTGENDLYNIQLINDGEET